MDLNSFRTDLNAENNGVWVKLGTDAELLIARWHTAACREAMAKYAKEFVTAATAAGISVSEVEKKLGEESSLKMMANVIADTILLGWRGNLTLNGQPLEYTRDAAFRLMVDPQLHDLREFVMETAMSRDNFLAKQEKELVGN